MEIVANKITDRMEERIMLKSAMIFNDNMVLQREKEITIWGITDSLKKVRVLLSDENGKGICESECRADSDGKWEVKLEPMYANRNLTMLIQSEKEELKFCNVQIGEVWIAGGQSNMEYWLYFDEEKEQELALPENTNIHYFDYPKIAYEGQLEEYDFSEYGFWRKCNAKEMPWFSAVAYYFAKKLEGELQIPIGIVGCNWSGTPACAWIDEDYMRGTAAEIWLREYEEANENIDEKNISNTTKTIHIV